MKNEFDYDKKRKSFWLLLVFCHRIYLIKLTCPERFVSGLLVIPTLDLAVLSGWAPFLPQLVKILLAYKGSKRVGWP